MSTKMLSRRGSALPSVFDDFFKPWSNWFDDGGGSMSRTLTVPAVNVKETENDYNISLAAPGMTKEDFRIDVENNMLTISAEKEESKEEKEERYTREEYNYSSFTRSFNLPEDIQQDNITAKYQDGILYITMPKKEEAKKAATLHNIVVK